MNRKRLIHTLRLWTVRNSSRRAKYLKDHHVFASMGDYCTIQDRTVPLYANLIRLGNNVHLAADVHLIVHDVAHCVLMFREENREKRERFREHMDCIEIGDNVFVGSHSTILGGVKIGNNVIVGGMSLVNRDVPDNSVVAGVPARVIGTFDAFMEKRRQETARLEGIYPVGQEIRPEMAERLWTAFHEKREKREGEKTAGSD